MKNEQFGAGGASLYAAVGNAVASRQNRSREWLVADRERPLIPFGKLAKDVAFPGSCRVREPPGMHWLRPSDVLLLLRIIHHVKELPRRIEAESLVAGADSPSPVVEQDAIGRPGILPQQPRARG